MSAKHGQKLTLKGIKKKKKKLQPDEMDNAIVLRRSRTARLVSRSPDSTSFVKSTNELLRNTARGRVQIGLKSRPMKVCKEVEAPPRQRRRRKRSGRLEST